MEMTKKKAKETKEFEAGKMANIMEIAKKALWAIENLVKKKAEKVISIAREGNEWIAIVEVLERKAVPDSQDLMARYEARLNVKGELLGYRQTMLKHRTDLIEEEKEEEK